MFEESGEGSAAIDFVVYDENGRHPWPSFPSLKRWSKTRDRVLTRWDNTAEDISGNTNLIRFDQNHNIVFNGAELTRTSLDRRRESARPHCKFASRAPSAVRSIP